MGKLSKRGSINTCTIASVPGLARSVHNRTRTHNISACGTRMKQGRPGLMYHVGKGLSIFLETGTPSPLIAKLLASHTAVPSVACC